MVDKKYVTRGALLRCDKGTHCRRINLIQDHGIGMELQGEKKNSDGKDHPFLLDTDVIVGTEVDPDGQQQNISWFGICNEYSGEDAEHIILKPDTSLSKPTDTKNLSGSKCKPIITGTWECVKESIEVQSDNGCGHFLTTDSYLICNVCGGKISFVKDTKGQRSDGTDYWDEQDKK